MSRYRAVAGAAALPLTFVAMLAATALAADDHDNAPLLRAAAVHPAGMLGAGWCEVAAGVLMLTGILALADAVRERGARLASVAATLGVLTAIAMSMVGIHRFVIVALTKAGDASGVNVLDHLDKLVPVVFPMLILEEVSLLLLVIAVVRAGLAGRPVLAGGIAFFVLGFLPGAGFEVAQLVVGLATFGAIAVELLRRPAVDREPAVLVGAPVAA